MMRRLWNCLNSSIEVTKTAYVVDNGDGTTNSGDTIVYTITVNNNGNTIVSSLTLVDNKDGNNRTLQLSSGPAFVSSTKTLLVDFLWLVKLLTLQHI